MAHSFIQAHRSELRGLRGLCACPPNRPTLLVDTYDTEAPSPS